MHSRPHRCPTNSWAAAVTLASGQRTSIVSSYQNHASPHPRTAASHCGLDNVSNAKKYKKSHRAFWESQNTVHTVTFRGAMVVYNRTITEKFTTNYFTSSGTPPSGREALQAQEPSEDAPSSLEQSYTILRKKKYIKKWGTTITILREVAQQ